MRQNQLVLGIKTFNRPACLARLMASIREFCPGYPIIIADDGTEACGVESGPGVTVLHPGVDVGVSAGRTAIAEEADLHGRTWLINLDDDFIFTKDTDVMKLASTAEADGYDILGGQVFDVHRKKEFVFTGMIKQEHGIIEMVPMTDWAAFPFPCDITPNFFAGRLEALLASGWDNRYRVCEHANFFMRAKANGLRVGSFREIKIHHDHAGVPVSGNYKRYRKRGWVDFERLMREAKAKRIIEFGVRIDYDRAKVLAEQVTLSV